MVRLFICKSEDFEETSVHRYHGWIELFMSDPELEGKVHCTETLIEEDGNTYKIKHWFYLEVDGSPLPLGYSKELVTQC